MAEHHGPDVPGHDIAATVDDAAGALLSVWDEVREQAPTRLSVPQLNALLVVERDEGVNLRGLAGRLRMILSSASRLCDRLVAAGLLEREPGRTDRREIALYLTPAGRTLLDDLRAGRRERLVRVLAGMSPAGRAALATGLTEFAAVSRRPAEDPAARSA